VGGLVLGDQAALPARNRSLRQIIPASSAVSERGKYDGFPNAVKVEYPMAGQQSASEARAHPLGQQPSRTVPEQRKMGVWAQTALQALAEPRS